MGKSVVLVVVIILALLIWLETALFRNRQQSAIINGSKRSVQTTETAQAQSDTQRIDRLEASPSIGQGDQGDSDQGGSKGSNDASTADEPAAAVEPRLTAETDESTVTELEQASTPPSISIAAPRGAADTENQLLLADIKRLFGEYPEVKFDVNSNALDVEAYALLGLIARYVAQEPSTALVLRGYTDRSGVRAYNLKLAEFRANTVKTYLVGRGISADSITVIAVGPDPEGPGGTTVPYDGQRRKVIIEFIRPAS
jgi:outer membrane protein OmpA-like peptidoglycan-associated protein